MNISLRAFLLTSAAFSLLVTPAAQAADSTAETLAALQAQINALQKQIAVMQAKEGARETAAKNVAPASSASTKESGKKEILPGVSVTVSGYAALDGVYRDKNMTTDTNTVYRAIPMKSSLNDKTDEFRASARSTRLGLLASGKPDTDTTLEAYFETDFGAAGTTSNSVETNSYTPRIRHAYATVDRRDWGFYFLGGQAYSLASLNRSGLTARNELGVFTIDASGPPAYIYTRVPQIRFVKDFADKSWGIGLSFEAPEVNFGGITAPSGASFTAYNTGVSPLNTTNYSSNYAPDIIAKVAYDNPTYGHYELFGLTRFFRDVVNATGKNQYAVGHGVGVGALVPILPKKLEFSINAMAGKGVGRYASSQLPDFAFDAAGKIKPLSQLTALAGLYAHPTPTLDLFLYAGAEKIMRQDAASADLGYGSTARNVAGCYRLGGSCSGTTDQTHMITQISPGFWKQVYKGDYGVMRIGGQYSLTRRDVFSGSEGVAPHAFENSFMMSFRYAPF